MSFMRKIALVLVICFILPASGYASPVVTDPEPEEPPPEGLVPSEPPEDEITEEPETDIPYDEICFSKIPAKFIPIIESMNGDPAELDLPTGAQYQFPIDETGPTVVVLLHGKTNKPERAEGEWINSILHPYHYWGFGFVRDLLNPGGRNLHVWNERGEVENFDDSKWRNRGLSREEMFTMVFIMAEVMALEKFENAIQFTYFEHRRMNGISYAIYCSIITRLVEEYNSKAVLY